MSALKTRRESIEILKISAKRADSSAPGYLAISFSGFDELNPHFINFNYNGSIG